MRSIEDAEDGEASVSEETLLSRCSFLKLCGSGLTVLAALMLFGAAGCGSDEDQQGDQEDGQQDTTRRDADQDEDRCPQRC